MIELKIIQWFRKAPTKVHLALLCETPVPHPTKINIYGELFES